MFARVQKLSSVLAFALVLGQAGLAAHVIKHSTTAPGQCVLCLNHVQPLTGLPAAPAVPILTLGVSTPIDAVLESRVATRPQYRLQARAPPALR